MADQKISALSAATIPLAGTEVVPIVQSGTTKKVAVNQLANSTTPGAGNFTSVDASGIITSTRTSGQVVKAESGGTGILYSNFANTGGNFFYGIDNSTGTALFTGSSAYAAFVGSVANTDFYLLSNNTPTIKCSSGNASVPNGNLAFSTAAKGINFTANTPAAGMTSQLLNWYEEGTWTPTVTAVSGTITTVSATGTYTRIGRQVTLGINIDLSNNGTGSGAIRISGMPFNAAATWQEAGVGREYQSTGNAITLQFSATNTIQMQNYDNSYPGASGYKFSSSITYNV